MRSQKSELLSKLARAPFWNNSIRAIATPTEADTKATTAVRAALARIATHPALIVTSVREGMARLSGPVFDHEVTPLLAAVRNVSGIKSVEHKFDVMFASRNTLASHQPKNSFGYQPDFIVGRWAPWIRVLGGISGLLLFTQGFRKRDALGILSSGIGALMVSRALTNRDITHLFGSFILPVMRMQRTIHISAAIDDVYDFWSHFENYPRFMSFIREVRINDSGGLRWTAKAPGGGQVSWDTTVFDLAPNQRIAWKSVPGSLIATEGVVQFKATNTEDVQVDIELSYAPPVGALGYAVAHFLGFDPRARIDEDLEVMKLLIEQKDRASSYRPDWDAKRGSG